MLFPRSAAPSPPPPPPDRDFLPETSRILDPTYRFRKHPNGHPVLPYKDEEGNICDPFYHPFPPLHPAKMKRSPKERALYFETVKLPEPEPLPEVYKTRPLYGPPKPFPRSAYRGYDSPPFSTVHVPSLVEGRRLSSSSVPPQPPHSDLPQKQHQLTTPRQVLSEVGCQQECPKRAVIPHSMETPLPEVGSMPGQIVEQLDSLNYLSEAKSSAATCQSSSGSPQH